MLRAIEILVAADPPDGVGRFRAAAVFGYPLAALPNSLLAVTSKQQKNSLIFHSTIAGIQRQGKRVKKAFDDFHSNRGSEYGVEIITQLHRN